MSEAPHPAAEASTAAGANSTDEPAIDLTSLAKRVAADLGLAVQRVTAAVQLLAAGNTLPFIARYRKEATGTLDEAQLAAIAERKQYVEDLEARRKTILESIASQGKLTDELRATIEAAETKQELEDLYLPYKPKRQTRAEKARKRGLGPLAEGLLAGEIGDDLEEMAAAFVDAEKEVPDVAAALAGARDIVAETVAHDAEVRKGVRQRLWNAGEVSVEPGSEPDAEDGKFHDLHEYTQSVKELPGHRILAANRGERLKALKVRLVADTLAETNAVKNRIPVDYGTAGGRAVAEAVDDGFDRLLIPSVEAEVRVDLTEEAEAEAIEVFAENMRHLLLEPPLGQRAVLGIDPGYRTGCKVAAVGPQGEYLEDTVIYPTAPQNDLAGAAKEVLRLVAKYEIDTVAVGNGTASRETETFLREMASKAGKRLTVVMVSESGASVYSASEVGREEFPHLDLTVRGAISIARRLQDPLAELVKIDPKSIGVGQYQHDVNQRQLKAALDRTVESCVNAVGVDLNTASHKLLEYVSGISARLAKAIVAHRDKNGPFTNRAQLKKVTGLGPKAYEQCAGFLRIRDGEEPLDNTAVHPESYHVVQKMAEAKGVSVKQLVGNRSLVQSLKPQPFVDEAAGIGLPTVTDIIEELKRPGRDPRGEFKAFAFADVHELKDLDEGMILPGIVTNVTKFGAFVDVGVHQDGLVHVSQLADRFVEDPADEVNVGQKVQVKVLSVDIPRKRIGLAMKGVPQQ